MLDTMALVYSLLPSVSMKERAILIFFKIAPTKRRQRP
jgi:hypothetical protein